MELNGRLAKVCMADVHRALDSNTRRYLEALEMTPERLYLFDTTLRDGQQTQGVQFSTAEKRQIATALDALGVDYIEGGWPGANPTDSEFFAHAPNTRATMTAFGMTKRVGRSAENDDVLAAVLDAGTPAVCLVGKTHEFHVTTALGCFPRGKPRGDCGLVPACRRQRARGFV